jgi:hypothetical protein
MAMHHVTYHIKLTGSQLFDMVMNNTARQLCEKYPGLNYEYDIKNIIVYGDLDDEAYVRYQKEMFGDKGEPQGEA